MATCIVIGCGASSEGAKWTQLPSDNWRTQQRVFVLDGLVDQTPPEHAHLLGFCNACRLRARNSVEGDGQSCGVHGDEELSTDAAIKLARIEYIFYCALTRLPATTIATTLHTLAAILRRRAGDASGCPVLHDASVAIEVARGCASGDTPVELPTALKRILDVCKHPKSRKTWACRPELSHVLIALDEERGVALGAAMTSLYLSRLGSAQTSAPSSSRASPSSASPAASHSFLTSSHSYGARSSCSAISSGIAMPYRRSM